MQDKTNEKIIILDKSLQQGFSQIPRPVLKAKGLSRNAKCLYGLLLDYAWQSGSCFPGQKRLAEDLDVSERSIQRDLEELRDFGLIKWIRRGYQMTNEYQILSLDFLLQSDMSKTSDQEVTNLASQEMTEMSHKEYNVENTQNKNTQSSTLETKTDNLNLFDQEAVEIAREFNDLKSVRFYQKIINQRNKGEIAGDDFNAALEDTRRIKRCDEVDGTHFLKNPAGWFVSVLQKLTKRRQDKLRQEELKSQMQEMKDKFLNKAKL